MCNSEQRFHHTRIFYISYTSTSCKFNQPLDIINKITGLEFRKKKKEENNKVNEIMILYFFFFVDGGGFVVVVACLYSEGSNLRETG